MKYHSPPRVQHRPMTTRPSKHHLLIIFGILIMFWPAYAAAQNATLTNIILTNTRDNLLLYLTVADAFPPKVKKAINSGLPVTFSFYVKLFKVRSFWKDEEIADITITHTIKYDNLKKEYLITRSGETQDPLSVKSFEEAKKLMAEVDSLTVGALKWLEKGQQYQIRAKAKLSRLTLPFYLHYVFFFMSIWDFETDWYTIDFIY